MVGSFAWPPALGGMGSGHLLFLSVPSLQGPPFSKHQWLEGCPTWGRARGRLLVKFSVWGGAAAHGPPAITLPLGPCCQEAGQAGSAWGWALINQCSCLGTRGAVQRAGRPEWQRSGSRVDRCEVRGQLPGLLLSPLQPAGARFPSGHSPARGPADPPTCRPSDSPTLRCLPVLPVGSWQPPLGRACGGGALRTYRCWLPTLPTNQEQVGSRA